MIETASEVPAGAIKAVNGRKLSVTAFSVTMLLDKTAEELGIKDYNVFYGTTMDTDHIYENYKGLGPYEYLTCICLNHANPGCSPEGTCVYSITVLPLADGWKTVTMDNYDETRRRVAGEMIDTMSKYLGTNLRDHILEIVIETPMTVNRYTGAWNGCIYGYSHSQSDNIVARLQTAEAEKFIRGLEFAGAHCISGDGMGPQVTNGRKAAKNILDDLKAKEAAKK